MGLTRVFFQGFGPITVNLGEIGPLSMHQRQFRYFPIDTSEIPLSATITYVHMSTDVSAMTVPEFSSGILGWPYPTTLDLPVLSPQTRPGDGADGVYPWASGYTGGGIANLGVNCVANDGQFPRNVTQYDPRTNLRWTRAGLFNYQWGVIVVSDNPGIYTYPSTHTQLCYLAIDVWWTLPEGGGGSASKSPSGSKSPSISPSVSPSSSQSASFSSSFSGSSSKSPSSSLSPSSSVSSSVSPSPSPIIPPSTGPGGVDNSIPCCADVPPRVNNDGSGGAGDGVSSEGSVGSTPEPVITMHWYRGCEGGGTVLTAPDLIDAESWVT